MTAFEVMGADTPPTSKDSAGEFASEKREEQEAVTQSTSSGRSFLSGKFLGERSAELQEPQKHSGKWGRRNDADKEIKIGDITRNMMSKAADFVRDIKHQAGDNALKLRENIEERVVANAAGLLDEEDQDRLAYQAGGTSQTSAAERWWCNACQHAHKRHVNKEEGTAKKHVVQRGYVDVRVLSMGEGEENPIRKAGGKPALEPVCQFALDGEVTGHLQLTKSNCSPPGPSEALNDDEASDAAAEARLYFQEIVGSDLRIHVWDKQDPKFSLGFEDQCFCGGAFIPLALILQHGSKVWTDKYQFLSFDAIFRVNLMCLRLVRTRNKLELAETSGVTKPKHDFGHVTIGIRLTLNQPLKNLAVSEPVLLEPRPSAHKGGHISDPALTLKAAANTMGRVARVVNTAEWSQVADELREVPAYLCGVHLWWAYITLRSSPWQWPALLTLILPLFSWCHASSTSIKKQCGRNLDSEDCLYVEEQCLGMERVQQAMKGVARIQVNILQLTDKITNIVVQAEKLRYVVLGTDVFTSAVFFGLLLVCSILAGLALETAIFISDCGLFRPFVWLCGCCFLVPLNLRTVLGRAFADVLEWKRKHIGDRLSRMTAAMWQRIPDVTETLHLDLCQRHVVQAVPVNGVSHQIKNQN